MNFIENYAAGTFITIKDGSNKVVKDLSVTGGTTTTVTRLGTNFFDGILSVGYYQDATLALAANETFRSFTVRLPKGRYHLCSDAEFTIIRRMINGEYVAGNVEYITAYPFEVTAACDVSFSFRRSNSSAWPKDARVWVARGSESMAYAEYLKQEVPVSEADSLTLLYGENNIFTDTEDAEICLTYLADEPLYLNRQIQDKSIHKIAALIRSGEISNIKIIGDSITHGVGGTGFTETWGDGDIICTVEGGGWQFKVNTTGACWANSFKHYIETKYPNATVNCWGTRGLSSRNFLFDGYYDDSGKWMSCLDQLITDEDDLVICMIGTNDRTHRANLEEFAMYMQQVIEYILGRGKKLLLLCSIPASLENETNGTQHFHMEDVNNLLCHFANRYGVWFISLYNAMTQYLRNSGTVLSSVLKDGLHPNDTGYNLMYQFVIDGIGFGVPIDGATWID